MKRSWYLLTIVVLVMLVATGCAEPKKKKKVENEIPTPFRVVKELGEFELDRTVTKFYIIEDVDNGERFYYGIREKGGVTMEPYPSKSLE